MTAVRASELLIYSIAASTLPRMRTRRVIYSHISATFLRTSALRIRHLLDSLHNGSLYTSQKCLQGYGEEVLPDLGVLMLYADASSLLAHLLLIINREFYMHKPESRNCSSMVLAMELNSSGNGKSTSSLLARDPILLRIVSHLLLISAIHC